MTRRVTTRVRPLWYTVVGVYTENWQKFCDHVWAVDAQQADRLVRSNPGIEDDLLIVGVFEGKLRAVDQGAIADTQ